MRDVIIIGKGPAAISAALYLCRASFVPLLIGKDLGALEKAESIENYYGLERPLSGRELALRGIEQARALGAELLDDEVFALDWEDGFAVTTASGSHRARALLLATGTARKTAPIPGLAEFEGRGVSYCAVCDGFFFRQKPVAVLGWGDYALHEAEALLPLAGSVTLLTNGQTPPAALPDGLAVDVRKVTALEGATALERVVFAEGAPLDVAGFFVALGSAAAGDLARRVGAAIEGNRIVVDESMATALPGLFAAGDCAGNLAQVSTAVGDGARAGIAVIRFLRQK